MNESIIKTLAVAFSVCLVCSLIVSASAVSLRDLQKENKSLKLQVEFLKQQLEYKTFGKPINEEVN